MSDNALTRRSFLVGSAGVAAVAAGAGFLGFGAWEQAVAAGEKAEGISSKAHSLCNSCSSKCGFTGYVENGVLTKMIGDARHPYCEGTLCARGYGYADIAYSKDRLTDPLKKNAQGKFEAITWDQAYAEISEKVASIIASSGPGALAMVQDPRPSGKYYSARFMNALGSPNVYTHGVACNMSKNSGFTQVIGASDYTSDVANCKMTMFIGRSYADAIRPSAVHAMQKAHEAGARLVIVDPRCNNSIAFADEWVPIKPGTDLAFVLGMAHVLVTRGLYDADYVQQNSVGFEEWAAYLEQCTPEWASAITGIEAATIVRLATEFAEAADYVQQNSVGFEEWAAYLEQCTPEWASAITGIEAATIVRLATEFAEAAPAASIEPSWRGAYGCSYDNSGETARAVCMFNTLLGCWNQKGGALFPASVKAGAVDKEKFPPVPKVEAKIYGSSEYPLSLSGMGVAILAADAAKRGLIKGMFFYNSNMIAGYSNPAYLAECVEALELSVAIDVQMSETAAKRGLIKGMFFYNSNMIAGYSNPAYLAECVEALELSVAIDVQMSETCMACQYVLPDTSYLERLELPEFVGGMVPVVTLRDQVIEKVHENTRPVDQIFCELAEACGVGEYFQFTVEELADAELRTVGLSLAALREAGGTVSFPEKAYAYGSTPKWKTPSGKVQFASDAVAAAGLPRTAQWREPAVVVPDDPAAFRLIGGKVSTQTHTQTANIESLMAITKQYGLDAVWINASRAKELGISDGDEVVVENEYATGKARAKVTERICPDALYLPSHYGCSSPDQHTAFGVGLRQMDYVPFRLEEGYGGACTQETYVKVAKVGA